MDPNENEELLPDTNQKFSVPQDDNVQPSLDLQDDKDQVLQDAFSDQTAAEEVGMPEAELKEALDTIAFDEHAQGDTPGSDGAADDWREHVEDLNEDDKER